MNIVEIFLKNAVFFRNEGKIYLGSLHKTWLRTENIGIFIRNKTNSTTFVIKISLLSEEIWLINFKKIVLRDATQLKA